MMNNDNGRMVGSNNYAFSYIIGELKLVRRGWYNEGITSIWYVYTSFFGVFI